MTSCKLPVTQRQPLAGQSMRHFGGTHAPSAVPGSVVPVCVCVCGGGGSFLALISIILLLGMHDSSIEKVSFLMHELSENHASLVHSY